MVGARAKSGRATSSKAGHAESEATTTLKRQETQSNNQQELRRQSTVLKGIQHVLRETTSSSNHQEVASVCLAVAQGMTSSRFGLVCEVDPSGQLQIVATDGSGWYARRGPETHQEEIQSCWEKTVRHGRALIIESPDTAPGGDGLSRPHFPTGASLCTLLKRGQHTFGMLTLAGKDGGYDNSDVETLEDLSLFCAMIVDHKRVEKTLSASEVRYRRLFETAKDGILILNAETGLIQDVNPFLTEMLGFSHEQLMGKAIWETGFFKDVASNKVNFEELQRRGYIRFEDLPLETADGRRIDVEFVSIVYTVNHRKVIQCNIREITDRKRAEDKLKKVLLDLDRSNKELEQFAYVVSHDLQEPLRMVSSYTQLLKRRYKDKLDRDAEEFITFAVDGAARMQRLIMDLLMYSRVGTRGKPPHPTDCGQVLAQALANLSTAVAESQAVVTSDDLPSIMADETQMVQLFQNLIGNAIKFHGDRLPRIHLSARQEEDGWLFSVKDNGIGIDPAQGERIFVVFRRLHQRDEYPGTGIGLAICKKIVERHGGRIWVEPNPDSGSTFYFTVPSRGGEVSSP
jgi:PAS domain S-box-containing protein